MEPAPSSLGQVYRFGLFEVDVVCNTLTRNGVRVKIQDQPLRVLILLIQRPGQIVAREELRQKLWPANTYVDFEGSLNVCLKKVRAAIDDDSDNPRFIETVPRHGYRFIAPVFGSETSAAQAIRQNLPVENKSQLTPGSTLPARPEINRQRVSLYIACALLLVSLSASAWFAWRKTTYQNGPSVSATNSTPSTIPPPVPLRKSVAVLDFHNISGRAGDDWLATAFPEMLRTELAGGEKLRLVSGADVANLRLASTSLQTGTLDQVTAARVGAALGSDVLVLGSYAIIGRPGEGQLRLDVRLQEARNGEILAEVGETGSAQDLFRIVSRVGARLRERLEIPVLSRIEEMGVLASLPLDPDAARFYTLGLTRLRRFDAAAAKDLLEQACIADPKFSLAHAMLARAWSQLGYEGKRRQEVKQALDLATELPRAEHMLIEADYYESLGNHEKSSSLYRALFELFPDSVEYGLQLATAQAAAGHGSQSLETLAQLRRLPSPASGDPRIDLVEARIVPKKLASLALVRSALDKAQAQGNTLLYAQGKLGECITLIYGDQPDEGALDCEAAYQIFLSAGNRLGAADAVRLIGDRQEAAGQLDQGIATYQRALNIIRELGEHEKTGAILNNMAGAYASEGQLDRARQLYGEAKTHFELAGDQNNVSTALGNIADIFFLRGNLPTAVKLYEQSLQIEESLDPSHPEYARYRLADLEWAEGQMASAHRRAQQAVDLMQPSQGGYQYLTGAMTVLGEILESEDNLTGARHQYQQALEIRKKTGEMDLVNESQVALAQLSLEEGLPAHVDSAALRSAIAEFEKEKADPDAVGAYIVLSRALLMQKKLDEARKIISLAALLAHNSPDPALKLPMAIQLARIEIETARQGPAGRSALSAARQQLNSTIASAKKLGYYQIECDARLALAEATLLASPPRGRSLLLALGDEANEHGLHLIARKARVLAEAIPPVPSIP